MKTDSGDGRVDHAQPVGVSPSAPRLMADGYASSLVEMAKVAAGLDAVDKDLRFVAETLSGHLELRKTLNDAQVSLERKNAVLEELFGNKVEPVTLNFVRFLANMGRVDNLPDIAELFAKRLEAEENKIIAEVTTAIPLDAGHSARLTKKLSELTGREVAVRAKVDEGLIGGIVVRIGGKLLDGSVRNQLSRLRQQMLVDMRGR